MAYKVIARRWRPQRFDDVIGQEAVTRTLTNAIRGGNLGQAFVFAGPRGVGKTTTARILARALNCQRSDGPTTDPCALPAPTAAADGAWDQVCDACREIAEGRDIDVLEIDAATHTQVDNVRQVIIEGLSIPPVRDRHKIFIIDEVHQLSKSSFNALLKSVEEPPPHAIFIMATTELGKVIDTILSRSQVFEFRTITTHAIADHLKRIAGAEGIAIDPSAVSLIARSAEGSMRDAQTALDQVRAFAGERVTVDDVATVLGLVGRDLLFEMMEAVADERDGAAFELPARAVEFGHDLRTVVRELSRLVRDLLVLKVDPSRVDDPDIAPEQERARLTALALRYSREDLLRAFDLLTRAERDIRDAAEPRYHLEMLLLRWMHLRKLVPLAEIIESLSQGELGTLRASPSGKSPAAGGVPPSRQGAGRTAATAASAGGGPARPVASAVRTESAGRPPAPGRAPTEAPARASAASGQPAPDRASTDAPARAPVRQVVADDNGDDEGEPPEPDGRGGGGFREALLGEIKRGKPVFYSMVVAQAQRIDIEGDRVVFTFGPTHRLMGEQVAQHRAWLEAIAQKLAGRKIRIVAAGIDQDRGSAGGAGASADLSPARFGSSATSSVRAPVQSRGSAGPALAPAEPGSSAVPSTRAPAQSTGSVGPALAPAASGSAASPPDPVRGGRKPATKDELRALALADEGFKALADVFPIEIKDVEEL